MPRRRLAALAPRSAGVDVVDTLLADAHGYDASLLPTRWSRMATDPLSFLRGAASLMSADLAAAPASGITVQLSGDAHVMNFGIFASPEGRPVFDLNDFDETVVGPFEWDVKRLATSAVVLAATRGMSTERARSLADAAVDEYRGSIERFSRMRWLEVWYSALDVADAVSDLRGFFAADDRRVVEGMLGRVRVDPDRRRFERLMEPDRFAIRHDPPHLVPLAELADPLATRELVYQVLDGYPSTLVSDRRFLLSRFRAVDVARQVVGVGSVGLAVYAVLLRGRDDDDPFFLQVKEARAPIRSTPSEPALEPAERIVRGQRLLQATPDAFLGWHTVRTRTGPRSFYVRQLYDGKASVALDQLDHARLTDYVRLCAWVLARAHARSGRAGEIAGYVGRGDAFRVAVGRFAMEYAARTHEDHAALRRALDEGRVAAASG